MAITKRTAHERREEYKKEFWPSDIAWTGEAEKGWFRVGRTLPLVLALMSDKKIGGNVDPSRVYLELLARHIDAGVIEMVSDKEHSYAAGYSGTRGVRTWQERMKVLEETGFIKSKKIGNLRYKYILLVHPAIAVSKLRNLGKVSDDWWITYRARQIETKETPYESLVPVVAIANVVPIETAKTKPAVKASIKTATKK